MSAGQESGAPFLIAGGGIGGIAAAIALAAKGIPSRVLEQASQFGEIGAGIQCAPNAFMAMNALGIRDEVNKTAVFVEKLIMMDSLNGREAGAIPLDDSFRARFGEPYAVIHRADLHRALLDAAASRADLISLETSSKILDVREEGASVVVTLEGGRIESGRALIGADGLWSRIREIVIDDGRPRVSGHIAYRAVLPTDEFPEDLRWNAATLWAGPKTHLVHYPLRRWELFNIVATFHGDEYIEGWNEPGDRDVLLHHFRDVGARPMSILERPQSWRRWVLCDRDPADNWSRGRITLLGDAAHPMLQYFAQGACMAMEDALCLADEVVAADGNDAAAFLAYQSARAPRTARVQLQARRLGEIYHMSGIKRLIRNWMLGRRRPERHYDGLAWLYGGV